MPKSLQPFSASEHRDEIEQGFVLVPVLWTISLLSLVAIILTKTIALDVRVNVNLMRHAEAEALADGITRLTIQHLAVKTPGTSKRGELMLNGAPLVCSLEGDAVTIMVFDTAGQIDLNMAPLTVLEQMFEGLGRTPEEADTLAAAIIDFRDLDDIPLAGGSESEAAQYRDAGLPYGPKNDAFAAVGELDQVLGMDATLLARVRPLVTVHSKMRGIDPSAASQAVLAVTSSSAYVPGTARHIYLIRVGIRHAGNTLFTREATVELSARATTGYLLREWNRADEYSNVYADDVSDAPSCLDVLLNSGQ
jgi:general secretion pathway protein K